MMIIIIFRDVGGQSTGHPGSFNPPPGPVLGQEEDQPSIPVFKFFISDYWE